VKTLNLNAAPAPVLADSLSTFAGVGTKDWRRDCAAVAGIYWRRRQPFVTARRRASNSMESSGVTTRGEVRQLPEGAKRQGALGGAFGRQIVCFALPNSAEFLKRERS